jgi:hypothetical protein
MAHDHPAQIGLIAASIYALLIVVWIWTVVTRPDQRCALVHAGDHCWNGVYDATWPLDAFPGFESPSPT